MVQGGKEGGVAMEATVIIEHFFNPPPFFVGPHDKAGEFLSTRRGDHATWGVPGIR